MCRGTRRVLIPILAALAGGCTDTAELTGTVRHRGEPLRFGTVQVRGTDGLVRTSPISSDGSYAVPGLTPGTVAVGVTCRDPREVEYSRALAAGTRAGSVTKGPRVNPSANYAIVPEVYADLNRSGLGTTLHSGENQYDIDLK
jgi:hypothetical protein